jgi:ankyrin repeat protein
VRVAKAFALVILMLGLSGCTGPNGRGWGDAQKVHRAAYYGDVAALERALRNGADPNAVADVPYVDVPTFKRLRQPLKPLDLAINKNRLDAVRVLVKAGAQVDPAWIPNAVYHGEPMVRVLLDGGMAPDTPVPGSQWGGGTALHWAAYYEEPAVARLLLERGANPNARDKDGDTPLMAFWWHAGPHGAEVARVLIHAGADPAATGSRIHLGPGGVMVHQGKLIDRGPGGIVTNTPLGHARSFGRDDIEAVLLEVLPPGYKLPPREPWPKTSHR